VRILITGGCGFIGSHTAVELLGQGHELVIVDNFVNSSRSAYEALCSLGQRRPILYIVDVRCANTMDRIFADHKIDAVIHFAGLKAVSESVGNPLLYYDVNLSSTLSLLSAMKKHGCRRLVFSSSATVYGKADFFPIPESAGLRALNPYGRTKLIVEDLLRDLAASDESWRIVNLRYFNPVGAHPSSMLGEQPNSIPNNLFPIVCRVASGQLGQLQIFGYDYATADGTCVRDFIHVCDLARGHLCALCKIDGLLGETSINLGTGAGHTVLSVVKTFERVNGISVNYRLVERRVGDAPISFADSSRANKLLGWYPEKSIEDMCRDAWQWHSKQLSSL
jgi:UDP-glucose 4-epimerase